MPLHTRRRNRAPLNDQGVRRGDRLLLPFRHHADEIALGDDPDDAGDMGDGAFVHRDQAFADEVARIDPSVGRPHDPSVQHAGQAHIVDEDQLAGRLLRDIDAADRSADHGIGLRRLYGRGKVDHGAQPPTLHKLCEREPPSIGFDESRAVG